MRGIQHFTELINARQNVCTFREKMFRTFIFLRVLSQNLFTLQPKRAQIVRIGCVDHIRLKNRKNAEIMPNRSNIIAWVESLRQLREKIAATMELYVPYGVETGCFQMRTYGFRGSFGCKMCAHTRMENRQILFSCPSGGRKLQFIC